MSLLNEAKLRSLKDKIDAKAEELVEVLEKKDEKEKLSVKKKSSKVTKK